MQFSSSIHTHTYTHIKNQLVFWLDNIKKSHGVDAIILKSEWLNTI